jgi:hypothetical protein
MTDYPPALKSALIRTWDPARHRINVSSTESDSGGPMNEATNQAVLRESMLQDLKSIAQRFLRAMDARPQVGDNRDVWKTIADMRELIDQMEPDESAKIPNWT